MEFERQGVALLRLDALQRVHHLHGDLGDGGKAEEGGQHGILLFGLQDDGFNCVHQNAVRVTSNQLIFATVDAANHPSQGWVVGTQAIDDRIGGNRGLHLQIVNGGDGIFVKPPIVHPLPLFSQQFLTVSDQTYEIRQ